MATKLIAKADGKASVAAPDLKTLAANPDLVNQLRLNGMRPHAAKPGFNPPKPNASNPPTMPATVASTTGTPSSSLDPTTSGGINAGEASGDEGASDGYASLMARNLARYMALQNKRSTPAKVNQAF